MSKKKETRGRKSKVHKPIKGSFNSVLKTIAKSSKPTRIKRRKR